MNQDNEIRDLESLFDHRTQIPNIIFQLQLSPLAFKFYCVIKMTAGDKGVCCESNTTLSREVGCSIPSLMKAKEELVSSGLINVQKRKHENGGDMPDLIQIVDTKGGQNHD